MIDMVIFARDVCLDRSLYSAYNELFGDSMNGFPTNLSLIQWYQLDKAGVAECIFNVKIPSKIPRPQPNLTMCFPPPVQLCVCIHWARFHEVQF